MHWENFWRFYLHRVGLEGCRIDEYIWGSGIPWYNDIYPGFSFFPSVTHYTLQYWDLTSGCISPSAWNTSRNTWTSRSSRKRSSFVFLWLCFAFGFEISFLTFTSLLLREGRWMGFNDGSYLFERNPIFDSDFSWDETSLLFLATIPPTPSFQNLWIWTIFLNVVFIHSKSEARIYKENRLWECILI